MNLYLIRHGETDWNAEGRLQGQTDISLNEKGKGQMSQVAEKMKQLGIGADLIVTSPLLRARQSADIVSGVLGYKGKDIIVVAHSAILCAMVDAITKGKIEYGGNITTKSIILEE